MAFSEGTTRRTLRHEAYTIACLCPMGVELAPVEAMLDEIHAPLPTVRDYNSYTLGRLGAHNVAIAVMPQIGNNAAVATVVHLMHDFPSIRFGVLVGIGGGVPGTEGLRLGDIVVSQPRGVTSGVVQYDMGKTTKDKFMRTGMLNKPPAVLMASVEKLKAQHRREGNSIGKLVSEMISKHTSMVDYDFPGRSSDVLFNPSYAHVGGLDCSGCDKSKILERVPRDNQPKIHYGTIGSANSVLRDGLARERLRDELDILAVEMEAAGTFESFPCLVIRGICDYSDTHKNKVWQAYAAAVAAGYVKELLMLIPPRDIINTSSSTNAPSSSARILTHNDHDPERRRKRARTDTLSSEADEDENVDRRRLVGSVPAFHDQQRLQPHKSRRTSSSFDGHPISRSRDLPRSDAVALKLVLDSLRFKNMETRHASIRPAITNSRQWLFTNPIYQAWLDDHQSNYHNGFLWIRGKPAAGKSTLMKFALAEYQDSRRAVFLASFFFNARGGELEKSVEGMYRSLLVQLLERDNELMIALENFAPLQDSLENTRAWTVPVMQTALTNIVKHLRDRRLTIFIDALDESYEDEVRDMVTHLEDMAEMAVMENIPLSICFSSRHYPHISLRKGLEMILEQEAGHQQDIVIYLKNRLKGKKGRQLESIQEQILRRCAGVFLWVVLVVEMLNKAYDQGRIHAMQRKLDNISSDLHALFEEILTKDDRGMEELRVCLQWILYASRPLKCEELYLLILFEVDPDSLRADNTEIMDKDVMTRYIIDCSKGLAENSKNQDSIERKEERIQFIHESVKDFLVKDGGLGRIVSQPIHDWVAFEAELHDKLKQKCYDYMVSHVASQGNELVARSSQIFIPHQLSVYGMESVLHHADAAEARGRSQGTFLRFFFDHISNNPSSEWYHAHQSIGSSLALHLVQHDFKHLTRRWIALAKESNSDGKAADDIRQSRTLYSDMDALSIAADGGATTIVTLLLATKWFSLQRQCQLGRTPLWYAANVGDPRIVELMLLHDRSTTESSPREDKSPHSSIVDLQDNRGTTPLIAAVTGRHLRVVELLLHTGMVDVHAADCLGKTPLLIAVLNGYPEIVVLLLTHGRLQTTKESGRDLLTRIITNTSNPLVLYQRQLMQLEKQNKHRLLLARAEEAGHVAEQEHYQVANDDFHNYSGTTEEQACAVIRALLTFGKLELFDGHTSYFTPLRSAIEGGFWMVAKLLIESGADINEFDDKGETLIQVALETMKDDEVIGAFIFGSRRNKPTKRDWYSQMLRHIKHHRVRSKESPEPDWIAVMITILERYDMLTLQAEHSVKKT